MAQELEQVFPSLVEKGDDDNYTVDYVSLVPVLVESIKEQQKMIEELNQKIRALEAQISELKK